MSKMNAIQKPLSIPLLIAMAGPAAADVSAADVWASWQENSAEMGQELSGEVTETRDGLIITDMRTSVTQAGGTSTGHIPEVRLRETGAGTVEIEASTPYTATTEVIGEDGTVTTLPFIVEWDGLDLTASGDPDALRYDYAVSSITMTEGEIVSESGDKPEIDLLLRIGDLTGEYVVSGAEDDQRLESNARFDNLSLTLNASAPPSEDDATFIMNMVMNDVVQTGAGSLAGIAALSQLDPEDTTLPENFDLAGDMTYGFLSYDIRAYGDGTTFQVALTNDGGAVAVDFSPAGLSYDISGRGADLSVQSNDLPVPVEAQMASTRIALTFPIAPEPEPSDFAVVVNYVDLVLNDEIWGLFDPGAVLPRDPATLRIDLAGTAQMFRSLLSGDPETFETPPGELRSLNLNELLVSAVGAELSGTGELTFAAGQIIPMPVGQVDLALSGLNALLDNLTSGGLLPVEQAQLARGMAATIARPGPGPDQIETTIVFGPDGSITANGFPIR
ncbi:DUF2125 domain-containing protein [Rhodobacterales bacterium HKCCE2091]|nr:DUF2125 domain-containing protein [Rhodobacterales bacterium HKCCE2091]